MLTTFERLKKYRYNLVEICGWWWRSEDDWWAVSRVPKCCRILLAACAARCSCMWHNTREPLPNGLFYINIFIVFSVYHCVTHLDQLEVFLFINYYIVPGRRNSWIAFQRPNRDTPVFWWSHTSCNHFSILVWSMLRDINIKQINKINMPLQSLHRKQRCQKQYVSTN